MYLNCTLQPMPGIDSTGDRKGQLATLCLIL